MGGISAASPSRGKCGRHLVSPSGRGSAAIASKTIPSQVVASATVRFVAVAILEVPIAGRARWFVRRPTVTDAIVARGVLGPMSARPARSNGSQG